jgi:2'-5' RNA ligase
MHITPIENAFQKADNQGMRLFIACPPNASLQEEIMRWDDWAKPEGRIVPQENLHVTLAFLGEQEPDPVVEALRQIPFSAAPFETKQLALWKNALVLQGKTDKRLDQYVSQLRDTLKQAGIAFDAKPFHPHITLARGCKKMPNPFPKAAGSLNKVVLYQSINEKGRLIYKPLYVKE